MPSMLDANQSMLAAGVGYRIGRHSLDAAYAIGLPDARHVRNDQNPAYDGNYDFAAQLVSLTYTLAF